MTNEIPISDDPTGLNKCILIFSGGMTFSWLIVWASFTTAPLLGRRFPLLDAFLAFAAAAVVTGWIKGGRWRNYQIVGLHLSGVAGVVLLTLHAAFDPTADFFSTLWLAALGDRLQEVVGCMTVCLVAAWSLVFWVTGARLGWRPQSYLAACNRFDLGLTAFFGLLLIQVVLVTRAGLTIAAPPAAFYLYAFFLCGLLAIGLARHRGMAEKQFLPGFRGIGILLIFAVVMLIITGLLATLASPLLTPLADEGYVLLKIAARPIGPILARILRFLFNRDVDYSVGPAGATDSPGALLPEETSDWGGWLARLLAEGLIAVLALALVALAVIMIWRIVQWLLKKSAGPQEPQLPRNRLAAFLMRLWGWLQYLRRALRLRLDRQPDIGRLFAALKAWGRLAGVRHKNSETPQEYAKRLGKRFPRTTGEIDAIVAAFQQQVYGEMHLDSNQLNTTYAAWRRLRAPLQWPALWRALFDRPRGPC